MNEGKLSGLIADASRDLRNVPRCVIFQGPCRHTMYADKLMQGHGLMQAPARVNRLFK